MGIQLTKGKNTMLLTMVSELDNEDIIELCNEIIKQANKEQLLQLGNTLSLSYHELMKKDYPKFKGISDEKVREGIEAARAQNESKNKLAEEMRRCFVDILDSEYIQKELTTYQLDPKNREIIVKKTKLKDERTNKRD